MAAYQLEESVMPRFTYGDDVTVKSSAPAEYRPGSGASVCGIYETSRPGGRVVLYLIEFGDGVSVELEEEWLDAVPGS